MSEKERRPNLLTRFMRWIVGSQSPFIGHDFGKESCDQRKRKAWKSYHVGK